MAYLVARALGKTEMAAVAVVGAVGDMQDSDGKLHSLNREILEEACELGQMEVTNDLRLFGRQSRTLSQMLAYASDPVIGDIAISDQEQGIAIIVAHEVAHHVQYRYGPYTRWLKKSYRKPHGRGFQDICRILRSKVINPFIEDCLSEAA